MTTRAHVPVGPRLPARRLRPRQRARHRARQARPGRRRQGRHGRPRPRGRPPGRGRPARPRRAARDRIPPSCSPTSRGRRTTGSCASRGTAGGSAGRRPILTGIPKNTYHDGGRLLVGPDSTLFVGTGDAGDPGLAQNRRSLAGKVLRITFDGRPAPGNPFPGSPVYTLGHRNVQGLAFDSAGRLWASEFGQNDVDELNLIRPGRNYGWPVHEGAAKDDRYVNPAAQWSPTSTASPSGIAILDDVAYVASLRGEVLWQVPLAGTKAGTPDRPAARRPRPAAHRRRRARRLALARHEQHRRARQPARQGRQDPAARRSDDHGRPPGADRCARPRPDRRPRGARRGWSAAAAPRAPSTRPRRPHPPRRPRPRRPCPSRRPSPPGSPRRGASPSCRTAPRW